MSSRLIYCTSILEIWTEIHLVIVPLHYIAKIKYISQHSSGRHDRVISCVTQQVLVSPTVPSLLPTRHPSCLQSGWSDRCLSCSGSHLECPRARWQMAWSWGGEREWAPVKWEWMCMYICKWVIENITFCWSGIQCTAVWVTCGVFLTLPAWCTTTLPDSICHSPRHSPDALTPRTHTALCKNT
jgi:hypothetical protein